MARRKLLGAFVAAPVALALTALTSSSASAADPREYLGFPAPQELVGYCPGFNVLVTYNHANEYIIHSTTVDGTTTLQITGYAQATVQNETTGKSITYTISGPGTLTINADGSFSGDVHGPNLLWTLPQNSYPGVPTISYTTGHVTFQVDANGKTTSYTLSGKQTDVCAALA